MKIEKVGTLIKEVAEEEILPSFRNLKEHEVILKSEGDFVTKADLAAEKLLASKLKALYPDSIITGEEDIAASPSKLDELLKAPLGFLIDPIDGTNNFIKGDERFAVMVVALRFGETVASWIYLPVSMKLAMAEKSSGAYLNDNMIILKNAPPEIPEMIGAAHLNRMPVELRDSARKNIRNFKNNIPAYCAGYDYIRLLEGDIHFSAYSRTLLWDHLPGTQIFQEAGGFVRQLDGKIYSSLNDGEGLLSASDEMTWHNIKNAIFQ